VNRVHSKKFEVMLIIDIFLCLNKIENVFTFYDAANSVEFNNILYYFDIAETSILMPL